MAEGGYIKKLRRDLTLPDYILGRDDNAPDLGTTIPLILGDADPGQALINAMEHSTKPSLMYGGDQLSGALELISNVDHLTDAGTPLKQVFDNILGADTTEFNSNTDTMVAASGAVADVGTEDFAVIYIGRLTEVLAGNRQLFGKKDAAPARGYELTLGASGEDMKWSVSHSGGGTIISSVVAAHGLEPQVVLANRLVAGGPTQGVWSRKGSASGPSSSNSLSSVRDFSVGAGRATAGRARGAIIALWFGAGAVGITNANRVKLESNLGY